MSDISGSVRCRRCQPATFFQSQLYALADRAHVELHQLYQDIGFSDIKTQEEIISFADDVKAYVNDKLASIADLRAQLQQEVACLLARIRDISRLTGEEVPASVEAILKQGLHTQPQQLVQEVTFLEQLLVQRKTQLDELRCRLQKLWASTGTQAKSSFSEINTYTCERIGEYAQEIVEAEKKLGELERNIATMKGEIILLWKELDSKGEKHDTLLDQFIMDATSSLFPVDITTFKMMEEKKRFLIDEKQRRLADIKRCRSGIKRLWLELEIPEDDELRMRWISACGSLNEGLSLDVIELYKSEYERLKNDRKSRLKLLVNELKPRLEGLWDELRTCEDDRQAFFDSYTLDVDEAQLDDLYISMLAEADRLETYLDQIRPLLNMMVRREWIKTEMDTFEDRASDPKRLFRNSTQLLNEAKFRKLVATEFPRLTSQLREQINAWEKDNAPRRIIFASYPYLDTMDEEKESPEFGLMHLRLLQRKPGAVSLQDQGLSAITISAGAPGEYVKSLRSRRASSVVEHPGSKIIIKKTKKTRRSAPPTVIPLTPESAPSAAVTKRKVKVSAKPSYSKATTARSQTSTITPSLTATATLSATPTATRSQTPTTARSQTPTTARSQTPTTTRAQTPTTTHSQTPMTVRSTTPTVTHSQTPTRSRPPTATRPNAPSRTTRSRVSTSLSASTHPQLSLPTTTTSTHPPTVDPSDTAQVEVSSKSATKSKKKRESTSPRKAKPKAKTTMKGTLSVLNQKEKVKTKKHVPKVTALATK